LESTRPSKKGKHSHNNGDKESSFDEGILDNAINSAVVAPSGTSEFINDEDGMDKVRLYYYLARAKAMSTTNTPKQQALRIWALFIRP
jgi:hypothetical protein